MKRLLPPPILLLLIAGATVWYPDWRHVMESRGVCILAGALLMAIGALPLLYIYNFASMVPPSLQGWAYWREVIAKMFNPSDAGGCSYPSAFVFLFGFAMFLIGIAMTLRGWCLAFLRPESTKRRD